MNRYYRTAVTYGSGPCSALFLLALPLVGQQPANPFRAVAERSSAAGTYTITRYEDTRQFSLLTFGKASFWLQPRRAYQECPPGDRLALALGMNLNLSPADVQAGAVKVLADSGVRQGRIEIGWGAFSYEDETKLQQGEEALRRLLAACRSTGVRPLILLNSNHGIPCPMKETKVPLAKAAKAGDITVYLPAASLVGLLPNKSGLGYLTGYIGPEVLFTRINTATGEATLSKPLPVAIAANAPVSLIVTRYAPFGRPGTPEFQATLAGWLRYTESVCRLAESVLGPGGYDLEIWNELTFGSNFLQLANYDPTYARADDGAVTKLILAATVSQVIAGHPGVGVSDGFNNQWPWGSGGGAPPGLAAIGKHPYFGITRFPVERLSSEMLDATGQPEKLPPWQPHFTARFPEQLFTGLNTEHLIRDLGPFTTDLYGAAHGRYTHPLRKDGSATPTPTMWVSETGVDLSDLIKTTTPGDLTLLRQKSVLRTLASFTAAGPCRVYFYAARGTPWGYLEGDAAKGNLAAPILAPLKRMIDAVKGAPTRGKERAIRVARIETPDPGIQFAGDPSDPVRHPALRNIDCVEVHPFQRSDKSWAVIAYIATRDIAARYGASYKMPEQPYRIRFSGTIEGKRLSLTLSDPLQAGNTRTLTPVAAGSGYVEVSVPLTDTPRILELHER